MYSSTPGMIHRYLSNGMEVYLVQNDFAPLVSLQVLVRAGSQDEADFEGGVAHVLEHMLFKGTKNFPKSGEIANKVEAAGGDINAYTTFDHTLYYLTAPSSFLDEGTVLLLDVVSNSLIDEQELERELEVVLEEIRRGRDNPSSIVSKIQFEQFYKGTRLARPVIGFEETVKGFKRPLVHGFYKRWYTPNNMCFIAAGQFDLDQLLAQLEKHALSFSPLSIPDRHPHKLPAFQTQHNQAPIQVIKGPWQECRLSLAVPAPSLEDPETPAWEMFASILGHGDTSRLSLTVKDELQLVTSADCGVFTPNDLKGFFGVSFYGREVDGQKAIAAIIKEIFRLSQYPPAPEEMRRVMSAIKTEKIYAKESVDGLTRTIASNVLTSHKENFDSYFIEQMQKVTEAEIQNVALQICKFLSTGEFTLATALSRESQCDWSENLLRESIKIWALAQEIENATNDSSPDENVFSSSNFTPLESSISPLNQGVEQQIFKIPHGRLHVNTRISNRLPIVSGALVWRAGLWLESEEKSGLASLTAQMLTRGTQRQSYRSFAAELEDRAASIQAFSARDTFGIRFDCLEEHAPRVLEMLIDCLFQPAFDSDEWNRILKETQDVLQAQKDSPSARLSRASAPLLYGNHPYSRPSLGTPSSVENILLDDVIAHWQKVLQAENFVFSLAGAAQKTSFSRKIWDALCFYRASDFSVYSPQITVPPLPDTNQNRIAFDTLEREQAHITLSFRACDISDPRRTTLELASHILGGQGGRLFMDLRDARSLAYSVHCSQSPSVASGVFSAYIGTAAHKAEEALLGLKSHIEALCKSEALPEELSRAKRSVLGGQIIDSQHHHTQASQLAMSDVYGLGFDNFLRFEERVNRVTLSDIQTVLSDLLQKNPPIISIVGPDTTWRPTSNHSCVNWDL